MELKEIKTRIDRRAKVSTDAAKETSLLVKALQALALAKGLEYMERLAVGDDGKFQNSVGNVNKALAAGTGFGGWLSRQFAKLIKGVVGKIKDIVSANDEFYEDVPETLERKAADMLLRRLGYNIDKDELIEGGWLQGLVKDHGIGRELGRQLGLAAETRMSPEQFAKQFRQFFLNPKKVGYLERYFTTFTHDFYMQVDRAVANVYRQELGYTNAIWSGTVMSETRPLCEHNTNKVFSEAELLRMQRTEFQGKKPNHNIFLDCGGYNCRHVLSWVSDELAEEIKKGSF